MKPFNSHFWFYCWSHQNTTRWTFKRYQLIIAMLSWFLMIVSILLELMAPFYNTDVFKIYTPLFKTYIPPFKRYIPFQVLFRFDRHQPVSGSCFSENSQRQNRNLCPTHKRRDDGQLNDDVYVVSNTNKNKNIRDMVGDTTIAEARQGGSGRPRRRCFRCRRLGREHVSTFMKTGTSCRVGLLNVDSPTATKGGQF